MAEILLYNYHNSISTSTYIHIHIPGLHKYTHTYTSIHTFFFSGAAPPTTATVEETRGTLKTRRRTESAMGAEGVKRAHVRLYQCMCVCMVKSVFPCLEMHERSWVGAPLPSSPCMYHFNQHLHFFPPRHTQKETTHTHLSINVGLGRSTKDWKPWMLATRKLKARSTLMWFMVCFGVSRRRMKEW